MLPLLTQVTIIPWIEFRITWNVKKSANQKPYFIVITSTVSTVSNAIILPT